MRRAHRKGRVLMSDPATKYDIARLRRILRVNTDRLARSIRMMHERLDELHAEPPESPAEAMTVTTR